MGNNTTLYPIKITNLTVDEYKEMQNDYTCIPFQYPEKINPIPPAIDNLVRRIEAKVAETKNTGIF